MPLVWIGLLLVIAKWMEFGPLAQISWWWVLAPLGLAWFWFEVLESALGWDKRKLQKDADDELAKKERIRASFFQDNTPARKSR